MRILAMVPLLALLAACGVESAGTAATAAAIKKQELEQGKNTMQQAQEKINAAVAAQQQRTDANAEK